LRLELAWRRLRWGDPRRFGPRVSVVTRLIRRRLRLQVLRQQREWLGLSLLEGPLEPALLDRPLEPAVLDREPALLKRALLERALLERGLLERGLLRRWLLEMAGLELAVIGGLHVSRRIGLGSTRPMPG